MLPHAHVLFYSPPPLLLLQVFEDPQHAGVAWLVYSSENNMVTHIGALNADYTKVNGTFVRAFVNRQREAPAVFYHAGKYFMLTSGCTGWAPNQAEVFVARWVEFPPPSKLVRVAGAQRPSVVPALTPLTTTREAGEPGACWGRGGLWATRRAEATARHERRRSNHRAPSCCRCPTCPEGSS